VVIPGAYVPFKLLADGREYVLGELLAAFLCEVNNVNIFAWFSFQPGMGVDETDAGILFRQFPDDLRMNGVDVGARAQNSRTKFGVKIDHFLIAGFVDRHAKIGERQSDVIGLGESNQLPITVGVLGLQGWP
jgi:hypothetical protein